MKGKLLFIVTGLVLGLMLFWKLELGLTRYFDADEFAYLHWAHNVFAGKVPYRDFLLYVPPGFLWVLSSLFFFFQGTEILTAGRVFAWVVYVGICMALGVILVEFRGWPHFAKATRGKGDWGIVFLPGIVLTFLPIPSDKFLEIRPDNLAMLIALIGVIGEIWAIREKKKNLFFWSGMAYGLSLLILPKTLPQVVVATLVAMWGNWRDRDYRKTVGRFISGLSLPIALFGVWALTLGDFGTVWYSLTRLPFEVNRLGELYPMQRDLFFYPNETYYGVKGWSMGLIANHAVWLIGLMIWIVRLLTPWVADEGRSGKSGILGEILVSGSMFAYIVVFMYGYELRHAQYLIPIAVFVALFAADGLRKIGVIGVLGVIGVMIPIFLAVNQPKMAWTNREDYARLERVLDNVPKDAAVFDLVGATIYYQDPYYVSAVPFGEWKQYLTRPLPVLTLPTETYIYRDKLGRARRVVPFDESMYHYLQ